MKRTPGGVCLQRVVREAWPRNRAALKKDSEVKPETLKQRAGVFLGFRPRDDPLV